MVVTAVRFSLLSSIKEAIYETAASWVILRDNEAYEQPFIAPALVWNEGFPELVAQPQSLASVRPADARGSAFQNNRPGSQTPATGFDTIAGQDRCLRRFGHFGDARQHRLRAVTMD